MGHIGDELGLHALGLGLLLHRPLHAGAQVIHPLAVALEVADQRPGVDALGEVARRQLLAALLQNAQVQGDIQDGEELHQLHYHKDAVHGAVACQNQKRLHKEQAHRHQRGFPDQRQGNCGAVQAPAHGPEDTPQQAEDTRGQGAAQHRPRLALGGEYTQEQQDKGHHQGNKKHLRFHGIIEQGVPADEKRADQRQQPQVHRDLIQPRQVDTLVAGPVSGRGHGEAEAKQRQQQEQRRQKYRQSRVRQQPFRHQIEGVVRGIRTQQVGDDGKLLRVSVCKGEQKCFLRGIQRLVAVRQFKVFKGDLAGILVGDCQMAGGVLTGKTACKCAGQIVRYLLQLLGGGVCIGGGAVIRAGRIVGQRSRVDHQAAQIVIGAVDGVVALGLVQFLPQVCTAVQKHIVVDEKADAHTGQNGHRGENYGQEEGCQLGPCFIQKSFHVRVPSIL